MSFIPPLPQASDPGSMQRNLRAIDPGFEHVFVFDGAVTARLTPCWFPRRNCSLYSLMVSLLVPGSSDTTAWVYKNGVAIANPVILAGDNVADGYPLKIDVAMLGDSDALYCEVTSPGTAAENLAVQVRAR